MGFCADRGFPDGIGMRRFLLDECLKDTRRFLEKDPPEKQKRSWKKPGSHFRRIPSNSGNIAGLVPCLVLLVPKSSFQAIRSPDAAKYHKD